MREKRDREGDGYRNIPSINIPIIAARHTHPMVPNIIGFGAL